MNQTLAGEPFVLSASVFKYWVIDRSKRQIRIICKDDTEIIKEIDPDNLALTSAIEVSIFDWEKWWVISQTKRGHALISEAYSPNTADPLHGRPAVYLDQNHWSTVAQAMFDPSSIKRISERNAAFELIHLAKDAGIVLPLSSGNIRETANLYGDRRYAVGTTIASLAGGWQMRHPLSVWRAELIRLFAKTLRLAEPIVTSLPVVTLEPHALLDDEVDAYKMSAEDPELFILALSAPGVILELLIDPDKTERIDPHDWVAACQELSAQLAVSGSTKTEKERVAYAHAWAAGGKMIEAALAELNVDYEAIAHISTTDLSKVFQQMPMLGYFTKLTVMRQINATHIWKGNDLTDMIFLSCAAAYADYVGAEKYTGTQLRQLQRSRGIKENVHVTLESLVEAIRTDGVKTASETC